MQKTNTFIPIINKKRDKNYKMIYYLPTLNSKNEEQIKQKIKCVKSCFCYRQCLKISSIFSLEL
jgi:hypothetical protein